MSHPAQMNFVESVRARFPDSFKNKTVLEVGSYNINGTVRVFFEGGKYIGLDVVEGNGVDVVCQGQYYTSDEKFDTVITCEMFEHNPYWRETWLNILKLCKSGGLIVMTCASTGRPEHGTKRTMPDLALSSEMYGDYYANLTEADFKTICNFDEVFSEYEFVENKECNDLYFFGVMK